MVAMSKYKMTKSERYARHKKNQNRPVVRHEKPDPQIDHESGNDGAK